MQTRCLVEGDWGWFIYRTVDKDDHFDNSVITIMMLMVIKLTKVPCKLRFGLLDELFLLKQFQIRINWVYWWLIDDSVRFSNKSSHHKTSIYSTHQMPPFAFTWPVKLVLLLTFNVSKLKSWSWHIVDEQTNVSGYSDNSRQHCMGNMTFWLFTRSNWILMLYFLKWFKSSCGSVNTSSFHGFRPHMVASQKAILWI